MAFVSDKLYNGYLRRNMPTIVTKVKPIEIMMHLPCLTGHDRENIEAKTETRGKYDGMICLLDCLKRRENWPEQFIDALEACEHTAIAAEIRAEYNSLKGIENSNPSSTVVKAHIHPAPSASHVSTPDSGVGGNSHAVVAAPAEAPPAEVPPAEAPPAEVPPAEVPPAEAPPTEAPPAEAPPAEAPPAEAPPAPTEPEAQAPPAVEPPPQLQDSQNSADQVPQAVSTPEPVAEPPQSALDEVPPPPSTPPPSPEIPHTHMTPQTEINSHQQPEENSESDIQDVSGDVAVLPDQMSSENDEVSVNCATTLQHPVEHCETDPSSSPDPLQTTIGTEERPPQSPSPAEIISDVTNGSSFLTVTPDKLPVQDTMPPLEKTLTTSIQEPEESSDPNIAEIAEITPQTETTAVTSSEPDPAEMDLSLNDDNTEFLSKPNELLSVQPQNQSCPTLPASALPEEPYSGNSDRLEISEQTPDAVTSDHVLSCSTVNYTIEESFTPPPCQENGIAPNHLEPEENHYESPITSLDMQEVLENVVQVSEEPSILNLDGQTSTSLIVNGEVAKETTLMLPSDTNVVDDAVSKSLTEESFNPPDPANVDILSELKTPQNPEEKIEPQTPRTRPNNTKYLLTAVGVGACALMMAWKFKN